MFFAFFTAEGWQKWQEILGIPGKYWEFPENTETYWEIP